MHVYEEYTIIFEGLSVERLATQAPSARSFQFFVDFSWLFLGHFVRAAKSPIVQKGTSGVLSRRSDSQIHRTGAANRHPIEHRAQWKLM